MQESYINQALIREIISSEQLLVMFQNDERMRSGRFT
jgi:glycerol-3-phosphate O-acyltransferase